MFWLTVSASMRQLALGFFVKLPVWPLELCKVWTAPSQGFASVIISMSYKDGTNSHSKMVAVELFESSVVLWIQDHSLVSWLPCWCMKRPTVDTLVLC